MTTEPELAPFNFQTVTPVVKPCKGKEPLPIRFDPYARAIGTSIALMVCAYFLWAQDFGNTGFAIFLILSAILFVWNVFRNSILTCNRLDYSSVILFSFALLLGCIRLIWQPNLLVCFAAVLHLLAIALAMQGPRRGAFQLIPFAFQSVLDGVQRWIHLPWERVVNGMSKNRFAWLTWGVPTAVGFLFLIPLIQSHPEIASIVLRNFFILSDSLLIWAARINIVSAVLVSMVGVWSLGVLLPRFGNENSVSVKSTRTVSNRVCSNIAYAASRNTLIVVNCIFVWFLLVEIRATWFREFPKGFIYSTYAHQGAAWLTIVLAMSTIAMSILFRSEIHNHPRISTLRKLAVGWSLCNALLVIAVFYRLMIYVNFNGMTRMRIIGFVGVACVFAGFVIVNFRMVGQMPIAWILHKQTRAVLWSIYLLALLPMDAISHGWNVSSIRSGYLAPAVQIAVQPISDEGLLCLLPLLNSDEPMIKEGVAALLAERFSQMSDESSESTESATPRTISWTQFQGSRSLLVHRLKAILPQLMPFLNSTNTRQQATVRLRDWSKRWY